MSAAQKSRVRHGSWLSRVLSDPWRKLAAVGLALLLWVILDRQINKDDTLRCSLHVVDLVAGREDLPAKHVLDVRIDKQKYTEGRFLDPDGQEIDHVNLVVRGPAHLIENIEPAEQFFIRGKDRDSSGVAEFELSDVNGDRDLVGVLKSMKPYRIRLELQPNRSQDIPLSHENVEVLYPPPEAGEPFVTRTAMEAATFLPTAITLLGTQTNLDKLDLRVPLFDVDLRGRQEDFHGTEIKAKMTLRDEVADLKIECQPASPEIRIPLRPDWEPYPLKVPVNLDSKATRFTPADFEDIPRHDVTLSVAGPLAAELAGKSPEELEGWAQDNLRVLAVLTDEPTIDIEVQLDAMLIFLKQDNLKESLDYKFEMLAIIVKLRKE